MHSFVIKKFFAIEKNIALWYNTKRAFENTLVIQKGISKMLDSLNFSLNAVLPIFLMVIIGFLLKKIGLIDMAFVKKTNKIVFLIFIPALLFYNIYKLDDISDIRYGYVIYSAVALVAIMLIGLPLVIISTKRNDRRVTTSGYLCFQAR